MSGGDTENTVDTANGVREAMLVMILTVFIFGSRLPCSVLEQHSSAPPPSRLKSPYECLHVAKEPRKQHSNAHLESVRAAKTTFTKRVADWS